MLRPFDCASPGDDHRPASLLISPDALSLVRFGLRAAEDPQIVDTVRAIDALLKIDLPQGPVWYRYNLDGYGEHEDGRPFDGSGIGRPWPLLTGERAHYELAARRPEIAMQLLGTLEGSASPGGLLPEQIWDKSDIPQRELFRGRPAGSAMPLVWAHAEHIKLLRSLSDGRVFDMPPQPVERYQVQKVISSLRSWQFNQKIRTIPAGKKLRVEVLAAAESIGRRMNGRRAMMTTRDRLVSESISSMCRHNIYRLVRTFASRSTGMRRKDGKAWTSPRP